MKLLIMQSSSATSSLLGYQNGDHSPPSSAEIKNAWSYTSTSPYTFMAWCSIKNKNRDSFTFFWISLWGRIKSFIGL